MERPLNQDAGALKSLDPMFSHVAKIILRRQMTKTSKGSTPSDSFFPVHPLQPNPHIPAPDGMAALGTAAGNPDQALGSAGSRCGCLQGDPVGHTQAPAPSVGAARFAPSWRLQEREC